MNEAETRAEHIDRALAVAGWGLVEGSRIRREYSITRGHCADFRAHAVERDAEVFLLCDCAYAANASLPRII